MGRLRVLFVTAFVDMVGLAMILPLLPYYAAQLGGSPLVVGVLVAAFSAAQLACAPAWGRLSDRRGRRPAILAGLIISAAGYLLFAVAGSVVLLLVSRLIQGIGGGTIGVVQAYVADASPPDRRTRSLGWLSAITSLGAVAGPALGSVMVSVGGRAAPGLAAGALSLVTAAFAWRHLGETRDSSTASASAAGTVTTAAALSRMLTHRHEPAQRLTWIYGIAIGAFYGTIPVAPLLLAQRFAVSEHTIGYFVMYLGGMGVVVRALILGPAVDALGEVRLARAGIVILAAGLAATGLATRWPLLALGFTLMPMGTAFLFPCITGLLSRVVSDADRGLFMGVQHSVGGVSRVAFPIAAGALMQHFDPGTPFWLAALLVLATLELTRSLTGYLGMRTAVAETTRELSARDLTSEFTVQGIAETDTDGSRS